MTGLPSLPKAMPGRSATVVVCSLETLLARPPLTRLTTTATSSRTSPSACRCAPVPMASIETNTPTAQVTPTRIVSTAPLRAARPPRWSRSRAVDWRRKFMTFFLALGQCGRNPEARREQRRHRRTYQRHQHCKPQTDRERDLRHRQPGYHARRDRQSGSGQCEPEGASQDTNVKGLRQNEHEHGTVREADGLEHCKLGSALVYRLHHHSGQCEPEGASQDTNVKGLRQNEHEHGTVREAD